MDERFGEVRSILNRGESARNWTRLCEVVDGFEEGELDQMVFPYVAGHVRLWNPRTCVAPREWVYRALRGESLPFWSMVRALDLSQEYLNSEEIATLLRSERLTQIEVMNLESNRIGAAGARTIAEAEHLGQIEELRLGFNKLMGAGVLWLCRAESLHGLRHLHLNDNALEDIGAVSLARAPWLAQLETFDLGHNGLHANAMTQVLEQLASTNRIKALVLDRNSMEGDQEAVRLLCAAFEQLERLDLRRCDLDGKHLAALGERASWPALELLDLSRNPFSDRDLEACLLGGKFPALRRVYLSGTDLTDAAIDSLSRLASLEYVELPGRLARTRKAGELREQGVRVIEGR